ncbi:UDP-glucose 4-epimerase GalE [Polynucleobacter sp. HIN8]|uniref:UDP-glucose 4-epimerase GalE n=1 Tax=Polynucleobacter sp. HIN8 TaxID=3047867 RepID=UPI0025742672|nr:UDP-glucose 4-epimerase GalE [Polynucleobacter sp. HIN8]BEI38349.1 UDP-glucose 4-epimerase GalE [Polynucleobacter sp. HIN8]
MNILLTGGLGYIGSHVTVVLAEAGHHVIILDNLHNCKIEVLDRLAKILGNSPAFIQGDVRNQLLVESVLKDQKIDAVMHFAGLKAVGESVQKPLMYYENNVGGTISLLQAMKSCQVKKIVFSSSATVYGIPQYLPLDEKHPTNPESPYGQTKLQIEAILQDLARSDQSWKIIALRYFNPVGAHESGLIGEEPNGIPNNLMPYISQVASGLLPKLKIFGNDYETPDGTGVRDYIHVMDLAEGHVCALNYLYNNESEFSIMNLGTGAGYSVLELVKLYQKVSSRKITYEIAAKRAGDIAACYANADKAAVHMVWKAKRSLEKMCEDSWRWQSRG